MRILKMQGKIRVVSVAEVYDFRTSRGLGVRALSAISDEAAVAQAGTGQPE